MSSSPTTQQPSLRTGLPMAVLAVVFGLTLSTAAQTFTVIHSFTGGSDGANPRAGLAIDHNGVLYGTAFNGATGNNGVVFQLSGPGHMAFTTLYKFIGYGEGSGPDAIMVSSDGSLYGTTYHDGYQDNGLVFHLTPPVTICKTPSCSWSGKVLYQFKNGTDGATPLGQLISDRQGNLYGATWYGDGTYQPGVIYELSPSNGNWIETVLYRFTGYADGSQPNGVVMGPDGNLYGTTLYGGDGSWGVVFQLSPSGSGWTQKVLYTFHGDENGGSPIGGLIFDQAGNIYGTTAAGGVHSGGTIFKMTPSNGSWTLTTLYGFSGLEECGPYASLTLDAAGSLYGTTYCAGAYQFGTVFKLTPSDGSWVYTSLHDFTRGGDGGYTFSNVSLDAEGNAYGTAFQGGITGVLCFQSCGVVWKIAP